MHMNKSIIRHGFILIFLALVGGLFVPMMQVPRLGLSAHTIGVLSGVLMIAIGAIWSLFSLSTKQLRWLSFAWLYSSYMNWLGCVIGATLGTGTSTPIVSAGLVGSALSENLVASILMSVGIASIFAVLMSLWGLRHHTE